VLILKGLCLALVVRFDRAEVAVAWNLILARRVGVSRKKSCSRAAALQMQLSTTISVPQGDGTVKEYSLTEGSKVEFHGDGISFGGSHQDGGGIGGESFRGEFDFNCGTREDAGTAAPTAGRFCRPLKG